MLLGRAIDELLQYPRDVLPQLVSLPTVLLEFELKLRLYRSLLSSMIGVQ